MNDPQSGRRRSDYFGPTIEDDEISLVDLFRVLMKNKTLIILVAISTTAVATFYAFSRPTLFEYSVNIDIGSIDSSSANGVNHQPVDVPQNVQANLVNGYIPMVLDNYRQNHPGDDYGYQIEASIPKGSSIVQLKAKGSVEEESTYRQLMGQVLVGLVMDHNKKISSVKSQMEKDYKLAKLKLSELEDATTLAVQELTREKKLLTATTKLETLQDPRLVEVPRRALEKQIALNQQKLSGLKEQETLIKAQDKRLDQTKELLVKQIKELDAQVASALQRQQAALGQLGGQLGNEARAMTMLMIDNEIQQNRDRLARLEERLYIGLENQREKLANALNGNIRSQPIQQQEILTTERKLEKFLIENEIKIKLLQPEVTLLAAQLKKQVADQQRAIARQREDIREFGNRLENIQPTRAVTDVITSWQPVGTGKRIIVMLGAVLGLMAGVFLAFTLEFLRKLRMEESQPGINEPVETMMVRELHNSDSPDRLYRAETRGKPLQKELA